MLTTVLLATMALGIDTGWEPAADGGLEYIIRIPPDVLHSLKEGDVMRSEIPATLRDVRRYRIEIKAGAAPRVGLPEPAAETRPSAASVINDIMSRERSSKALELGPNKTPNSLGPINRNGLSAPPTDPLLGPPGRQGWEKQGAQPDALKLGPPPLEPRFPAQGNSAPLNATPLNSATAGDPLLSRPNWQRNPELPAAPVNAGAANVGPANVAPANLGSNNAPPFTPPAAIPNAAGSNTFPANNQALPREPAPGNRYSSTIEGPVLPPSNLSPNDTPSSRATPTPDTNPLRNVDPKVAPPQMPNRYDSRPALDPRDTTTGITPPRTFDSNASLRPMGEKVVTYNKETSPPGQSQPGNSVAKESAAPRPWLPFLVTGVGLIGSLAGNGYLAWMWLETRRRYRALLREQRPALS